MSVPRKSYDAADDCLSGFFEMNDDVRRGPGVTIAERRV